MDGRHRSRLRRVPFTSEAARGGREVPLAPSARFGMTYRYQSRLES